MAEIILIRMESGAYLYSSPLNLNFGSLLLGAFERHDGLILHEKIIIRDLQVSILGVWRARNSNLDSI